jgi:hypothetical protein
MSNRCTYHCMFTSRTHYDILLYHLLHNHLLWSCVFAFVICLSVFCPRERERVRERKEWEEECLVHVWVSQDAPVKCIHPAEAQCGTRGNQLNMYFPPSSLLSSLPLSSSISSCLICTIQLLAVCHNCLLPFAEKYRYHKTGFSCRRRENISIHTIVTKMWWMFLQCLQTFCMVCFIIR